VPGATSQRKKENIEHCAFLHRARALSSPASATAKLRKILSNSTARGQALCLEKTAKERPRLYLSVNEEGESNTRTIEREKRWEVSREVSLPRKGSAFRWCMQRERRSLSLMRGEGQFAEPESTVQQEMMSPSTKRENILVFYLNRKKGGSNRKEKKVGGSSSFFLGSAFRFYGTAARCGGGKPKK